MATLTESAPANLPDGTLPPLHIGSFSPPTDEAAATKLGGVPNGRDVNSPIMTENNAFGSHGNDVCNNGRMANDGPRIQEEFDKFQDHTFFDSQNFQEETPLVSMANGRAGSSQEEEECGSECGLMGGEGLGQLRGSRELLQTCSSASGDGSSVWSEDGSNERGSPQYGLLDSGADSEHSSTGCTPVSGELLSLPSDLNHVDSSTTHRQVPLSEANAMELIEGLPKSSLTEETLAYNVQSPPLSPLSKSETLAEDCGHPVVDDVVTAGESEPADSVFVVNLVGHMGSCEPGEPGEPGDGGECEVRDGDGEERGGESGGAMGVGVVENEEGESGEVEVTGSGGSDGDSGEVGEEVDGDGVMDVEPGVREGDGVEGASGDGGAEGENGETGDKAVVGGTGEGAILPELTPEDPPTEPASVIISPPSPLSPQSTATPEHQLRSSIVMESGDSEDPLLESYLDSSNLDSRVRPSNSLDTSSLDSGVRPLQNLDTSNLDSGVRPSNSLDTSNLDSGVRLPQNIDSSSLDSGVRPPQNLDSSSLDSGVRPPQNLDSSSLDSGVRLPQNLDSSSLDSGVRPPQNLDSSSLDSGVRPPQNLDSSSLDSGVRPPQNLDSSSLDSGVRPPHGLDTSSLDSRVRPPHSLDTSSLDSGERPLQDRDSSDLDSGVRPPRDSRSDLPVLQPLSPDPDLNEQYEYLRRTLSHSRRRYSTRRRRPHRRENRGDGVQRSESSVGVRREVRDMLQNPETRRVETHVDVHGRTYFMDHDTHTVAYETSQAQTTDISRGMEMLERRYLSLQRSFRSQRPSRFAQPNLSTIPSSPSTPLDLSLSLSRAEAESLSQARTSRSQSGTSHSKKKSSRRWFWQRSYRSVSQTRTESSADDDILPISPGWEGSPPPAVTESGEVVERGSREGSRSSEATLSGSVAGTSEEGEGERTPEPAQQAASVSSEEVVSGGAGGGEGEVVVNGEVGNEREGEGRREGGGDEVFTTAVAPAPSRQSSIMRASGMGTGDRGAANRAKHRVRATTVRSRHRPRATDRDTDDETNEVRAEVHHRPVTSPTPEEGEEQEEEVVKEQPVPPATPTSAMPLPEELLSSPALRFIARRDLFSFLSNAGDAGEMFLANRGLMELVQRIRTNNNLFAKYQHSRQLVVALNRFTDTRADLPQNWEKKLNREGKVFYIDHTHCVTSFIDPRLPLLDHEFTYTTPPSSKSSQHTPQLQFGEEAPIRAHHTTVMSSSVPSPPPSTSPPPTISIASPQPPQGTEMTYEKQVVSFFRLPDIYQRISQRYRRGVRPQLREIIEDVRANGTSALERIQTSGSVAAYELALVLSLFEEDISAINTMIQVVTPQPVREDRMTGGPLTVSTLQRKKEAFSTKLQNFKVMMARLGFAQSSRLKFNIRRDHLLEDSYEHVMKSDIRHLQRKRLNICFKGEDGLDYGGPSREFFFLLSREVFNPYYSLFEYSANDTYTVQISSTSMFIQNNLDWFRFAGRVIGLVIVQGFLLDVFFTRTIYKALANRAPSLKDLESLEPAFYSSLVWISDNDPEPLDLTFTVDEEAFGELTTHELKEGGMDIPVTEDNKEEYVHLMLRWRLDRGITSQMNMLRKGFSEVMPVSLLQAFDASELEFLTAGTLEIDIDDWKKHTEYRNGYHPMHPVILFFWQAVESFDNEQRLRLLQFVTGTSSVPFEGFKALRGSNGPKRFTVDFFSDVNSLPRTHTCFNRIDLPPYPSYDVLYHKLLTAIEEGNTFGIE